MVSAWEVLRHRLQLRLRAGGSATNAVSRRIPPRLQGAPNKRKLATSDTFEDALRMLEARHEKEVHDLTIQHTKQLQKLRANHQDEVVKLCEQCERPWFWTVSPSID